VREREEGEVGEDEVGEAGDEPETITLRDEEQSRVSTAF